MKRLEINKDTKALIESVIKESPNYRGNEELSDLFCEAIYKKSYLLIDAIRDKARLKRHLKVICDASMSQIIKEKARFDETKGYSEIQRKAKLKLAKLNSEKKANRTNELVSLKKSVLDEQYSSQQNYQRISSQGIVNLKEEIQRSEKYDSVDNLIDPLDFCPQKRVSAHTLEKLVQVILNIDSKFPKKGYYEIFAFRYIRKYSQMETARELKISQIELSKRFVELIKLIREAV